MNKLCCICQHPIEKDDAPVIAMSGYGNPKCACERCEKLIDTATGSHDPEEISAACKSLGEALTKGNTGDEQIITAVNDIIYSAHERCNAIKDGTYDFSLDELDEEDSLEEIPEELLESEEDKQLDEEENERAEKLDKVLNWIWAGVMVAAVAFFAWWFFFR